MKKLRAMLASMMVLGLLAISLVAVPKVANAALFDPAKDQACNGAALQDSGGCSDTTTQTNKVNDILTAVLNIFSFVIGVTAVIMIIIGAMRFITAQGDASSIASARNTIIYAVIGLIVAAVAQFFVQFVIGKATGVVPKKADAIHAPAANA